MSDATLNSGNAPVDPRNTMAVGGITLPQWKTIWLIVGLIGAVVAPYLFLSDYQVFQATLAFIYAIAILGKNVE